jgi:hypothetical protein
MWDEGLKLPNASGGRPVHVLCGTAIKIADREPRLAEYMDVWRESNVNRVPLCGAASSDSKAITSAPL